MDLVAPAFQAAGDAVSGGELLEAQFRLGMDGAAQFDHRRRDLDDVCWNVVDVH
ncbi:hypothetical protein D3C85_799460 [compost metagenome]